jgi:RES domain-containing protein
MEVYKICRDKYANKLSASGVSNCWNKEDELVIYVGSSIALAALENVAHRASINIAKTYKLLKIEIKEPNLIKEIDYKQLPKNWRSLEAYIELQEIGSAWYQAVESLILKVPSAIVSQEFNYVINTKHPLFFSNVVLQSVEEWVWDKRLL